MICRICSGESSYLSKATILHKYRISYFECSYCGYIQTEDPYWYEEAYSDAISNNDIGIIGRNLFLSKATTNLISVLLDRRGKFLDFGGGYGLFVRLMRDNGFDFYRDDKFCENIFAKGFDLCGINIDHFEMLTAFEVLEHFVCPGEEIRKILDLSTNIFFTTQLVPSKTPNPSEWWYYLLDSGQHIGFFREKTLSILGESLGLNFYTNHRNIHFYTKKKISPLLFKTITNSKISRMLYLLLKNKSLIQSDYYRNTGTHIS